MQWVGLAALQVISATTWVTLDVIKVVSNETCIPPITSVFEAFPYCIDCLQDSDQSTRGTNLNTKFVCLLLITVNQG